MKKYYEMAISKGNIWAKYDLSSIENKLALNHRLNILISGYVKNNMKYNINIDKILFNLLK